MRRAKKIMIWLLNPGIALTLIMFVFCTAALICVFTFEQEETIAAYVIYSFSTYSFSIFAIALPKLISRIKSVANSSKFGNRYMNDITLRIKISLYLSLVFNLLYAVFKMIAGVYYASFWYGADAIFYIVLSAARFLLLRYVRKEDGGEALDSHGMIIGFKKYRFCGILIFVLNAAYLSVVYQIINYGMGYKYPGVLIYVVAMFTFYCITVSIINIFKNRKCKNPIFSAQRAISFVKALVAMFALQTAMFASFSEDIILEQTMNTVVGISTCSCIFVFAVFMVTRANKEIKLQSRLQEKAKDRR